MATTKFTIPEIIVGQAQKEVTHNEALAYLDALLKNPLVGEGTTTPPATPTEGEFHTVGVAATGVFTGKDGLVAGWINGLWVFFTPFTGMSFYSNVSNNFLVYDGTNFVANRSAPQSFLIKSTELDGVGGGNGVVNTNNIRKLTAISYDDTNAISLNTTTNEFTVPAGTWDFDVQMSNNGGTGETLAHLTSTGGTVILASGISQINPDVCVLRARLTFATPTILNLSQWIGISTALGTDFGSPTTANAGLLEEYVSLKGTKIA